MGIFLSAYMSYVGINEAIECMRHLFTGIVPDTDRNFDDLVELYTRQLRQSKSSNSFRDWVEDQGYVTWTEDKNGNLTCGAIKFHGTPSNSTALLFSTKISSFGQSSVEEPPDNEDNRKERPALSKTQTIISSNTSESFSIETNTKSNSYDPGYSVSEEEPKNKLTWQYTPKDPSTPVPEIHFQEYDDEKRENITHSEDYLRSLDGIKFRPLQRSDPSGRRRSFRKRYSSSSNSSRESRESREEELKMFTSLEEAEFSGVGRNGNSGGFGSTPNLAGRSYSRSRSRERSKDRRDENDNDTSNRKTEQAEKDLTRLSSFEETVESNAEPEVNEGEEEVDFWSNLED